jgi:hypothetical protein
MTTIDPTTIKALIALAGIAAVVIYAIRPDLLSEITKRIKKIIRRLKFKLFLWRIRL